MTTRNLSTEILNLVEIMAKLRSPSGCPWDKKQTPESLKPYIIEEAYELIEAIDSHDTTEIRDELGDLLLQVVFIAQIFSEQKLFGMAEIAHSISSKLIRRHPHVFADADANEHAQRWEEIKRQERSARGRGNKLANRIPVSLPALKKATKVAGEMDNESQEALVHKITQKFSKLSLLTKESVTTKNQLESTLGDIFFQTVQLANTLQLDAEDLLRRKTMKVMTEIDH